MRLVCGVWSLLGVSNGSLSVGGRNRYQVRLILSGVLLDAKGRGCMMDIFLICV